LVFWLEELPHPIPISRGPAWPGGSFSPELEVPVLIKGFTKGIVCGAYFGLLLVALVAGCTTREEPSEQLDLCGNHSCGHLIMVTTDTSSKGYQYLDPAMSPDGNRIVFTADWEALPSTDRPPDPIPSVRQFVVVDVQERYGPAATLRELGAQLVRFDRTEAINFDERQKGDPIWFDDDNLVFWLETDRGTRLFRSDYQGTPVSYEPIFEVAEDQDEAGRYFQYTEPALSPIDSTFTPPQPRFLAFTVFACVSVNPDSFNTCTGRAIQVYDFLDGSLYTLTTEVAQCGAPAWSTRGDRLAFYASLDIVGDYGTTGTEIFSLDFDPTGLAPATPPALNRGLRRLTYTEILPGDPLTGIKNTDPKFSPDLESAEIFFVSTRRAPSLTYHDRNIWRMPSDGSLDPEIVFFTREDDVDPSFSTIQPREIVFSSSFGFPTYMLDQLEQDARERIQDLYPALSQTEIDELAAEERDELEFFSGVMSHIYIFSNW